MTFYNCHWILPLTFLFSLLNNVIAGTNKTLELCHSYSYYSSVRGDMIVENVSCKIL